MEVAGNREKISGDQVTFWAKLQEKRSSGRGKDKVKKKTVSKNNNGQSKNEIEIQGRVAPRFVSFRLASEQVTGACRWWLTLHHNLMKQHGRLVHIHRNDLWNSPRYPESLFGGERLRHQVSWGIQSRNALDLATGSLPQAFTAAPINIYCIPVPSFQFHNHSTDHGEPPLATYHHQYHRRYRFPLASTIAQTSQISPAIAQAFTFSGLPFYLY